MKLMDLLPLLTLRGLGVAGGGAPVATLTVTTTSSPQTVTLTRITPTGGDCIVTWGDGDRTTITDGNTGSTAHQYATAGTYPLTIFNFSIITHFDISGQSTLSGDVSGWTLPASLVTFYIYSTSVSGDVSGWTLPASLVDFFIRSTSVSGVPSTASAVALANYQYQNCGLLQADVDGVAASIYTRRAAFTNATPSLNLGSNDATPSGAYADEDPPVTGLGYIYEIVNDPETEGFNTWSVTWNGGAAP